MNVLNSSLNANSHLFLTRNQYSLILMIPATLIAYYISRQFFAHPVF